MAPRGEKHSEVLDEIDLQINHYRQRNPHIDAGADWQTSHLLSDCQDEPTLTTCLGSLDFMPHWGEVSVKLKVVYNTNVGKKKKMGLLQHTTYNLQSNKCGVEKRLWNIRPFKPPF